eukprot:IDg12592t1
MCKGKYETPKHRPKSGSSNPPPCVRRRVPDPKAALPKLKLIESMAKGSSSKKKDSGSKGAKKRT